MSTNHVHVQSNRVTAEGDTLYYEVRGQGQPLLLIAPAGGDGWQYSYVADILADEYKVITYDRRANSRSTINHPQHFDISQQSRDVVAVLQAAGEESAFIFGNSSGGVIALDVAKMQPQVVRALIVHEPPLARVHPQSEQWQRFFASVYSMSFRFGSSLAALRFMLGAGLPVWQLIQASKFVNVHREQSKEPYLSSKVATDFLIKQELLPITNYLPDIEAIKKNKVRVIMAAGKTSLENKRFYAQTVPILAEQFGCEMVIFPGHHGSFMDMPVEWSATLRTVLRSTENTAR